MSDTRRDRLRQLESRALELANAAADMRGAQLERDRPLTAAQLRALINLSFDVVNAVSNVKRAEATE